jgi:hypothetical protein
LGLVKHLAFMERRWIVWGFLGRDVDEPWGDSDPDGPGWRVRDDETLADLLAAMRDGAVTTAEVARSHALTDSAAETGRFAGESRVPTLAWTLFHVLQEYARHAGHLDVVRELIDGATGE